MRLLRMLMVTHCCNIDCIMFVHNEINALDLPYGRRFIIYDEPPYGRQIKALGHTIPFGH